MVDLTREQIDRAQSRWDSSDYLAESEATALFAMARAYLSAVDRQQAGYACAMCPDLAGARIDRDTYARRATQMAADLLTAAQIVAASEAERDTARAHATAAEEPARMYSERSARWEQEAQRLAAEACPPLVWESNHEAGDGQDVCEACGTELEEPHTWRECMAIQRVAWRRDDKIGEEMRLEEVHRLTADRDKMAAVLAETREFIRSRRAARGECMCGDCVTLDVTVGRIDAALKGTDHV